MEKMQICLGSHQLETKTHKSNGLNAVEIRLGV